MSRPIIGLTMDFDEKDSRYELNGDYVTSIEKAGGLPLAIPFCDETDSIPRLLDLFDGILFIGGDDLDPSLYGESWHEKAIRIHPRRQGFELALVAEVERRRMPALGICLGCQLLNVHRGGSLHQFIPDLNLTPAIEHRKADRPSPRHSVSIDPKTQLGLAIGQTEMETNSYHMQAIRRLGRNLRLVASAPDGVIEGFEDPDLPLFAAVQWHPERLHDRSEQLALFRLLVEKSAAARSR